MSRYGKRILAEPPAAGFDRMLYITPFVMMIASLGLVFAIWIEDPRRKAPRWPVETGLAVVAQSVGRDR